MRIRTNAQMTAVRRDHMASEGWPEGILIGVNIVAILVWWGIAAKKHPLTPVVGILDVIVIAFTAGLDQPLSGSLPL